MTAPREGLSARGITKRYGGIVALDGVDLDVGPGRVTALIGPNGAGKTTLFDCLTGHQRPDAGTVHLDGTDLTPFDVSVRSHAGVARTFQRLEVFTGMTVFENLLVAAEAGAATSLWRELLRPQLSERAAAEARRVLAAVGLGAVADIPAGDLPTGTLRLVELARALCTRPRVLLLDEPASGLDLRERAALRRVLAGLADEGMAILLVEHDVELVLDVSHLVYVLDLGRIVARGTPEAVRADGDVRRVYLGAGAT